MGYDVHRVWLNVPRSKAKRLLRLEEQDRAVAEVEVDEVLRLCY